MFSGTSRDKAAENVYDTLMEEEPSQFQNNLNGVRLSKEIGMTACTDISSPARCEYQFSDVKASKNGSGFDLKRSLTVEKPKTYAERVEEFKVDF